jgi:hypothetical protein
MEKDFRCTTSVLVASRLLNQRCTAATSPRSKGRRLTGDEELI